MVGGAAVLQAGVLLRALKVFLPFLFNKNKYKLFTRYYCGEPTHIPNAKHNGSKEQVRTQTIMKKALFFVCIKKGKDMGGFGWG